MYPAVAIPPSHSRAYRSLSPVLEAKSALVTGPLAAGSSKSPRRSPTAARSVTSVALVSAKNFADELIDLRLIQNGLRLHVPPSFHVHRGIERMVDRPAYRADLAKVAA